ncbi:hypothetical protein Adt_32767 [Abeliophyllum distichum]|uniref:Uncharacterized protein n=1 Tax=Abeliophyllum distichum TaxID=126358 RepID=A0ABD1QX32_9LAMI
MQSFYEKPTVTPCLIKIIGRVSFTYLYEIHDGPPIWSSSQQSWATDTITMQRRRDDDDYALGFWVRSRSAERPRNGFWGSEQKGLQLDFGVDFERSKQVEMDTEMILGWSEMNLIFAGSEFVKWARIWVSAFATCKERCQIVFKKT